jgi:hypothetical protein
LSSIFFKRGSVMEYVRPGTTFCNVHPDKMVETATVLSVSTDSFGIPHVRFRVSFRRPDQNMFDGGDRLLAIQTFAERYTDRVIAQAA